MQVGGWAYACDRCIAACVGVRTCVAQLSVALACVMKCTTQCLARSCAVAFAFKLQLGLAAQHIWRTGVAVGRHGTCDRARAVRLQELREFIASVDELAVDEDLDMVMAVLTDNKIRVWCLLPLCTIACWV